MTAPTVYARPPAKSHHNPSAEKLFMSGLMAKTISQPINRYMAVDACEYFPVKNNFRTMPIAANPQEIPNISQPSEPLRMTSIIGV